MKIVFSILMSFISLNSFYSMASHFLDNSCKLIIEHNVEKNENGKIVTNRFYDNCSAVAINESTVLTGFHCLREEKLTLDGYKTISKKPLSLLCGYTQYHERGLCSSDELIASPENCDFKYVYIFSESRKNFEKFNPSIDKFDLSLKDNKVTFKIEESGNEYKDFRFLKIFAGDMVRLKLNGKWMKVEDDELLVTFQVQFPTVNIVKSEDEFKQLLSSGTDNESSGCLFEGFGRSIAKKIPFELNEIKNQVPWTSLIFDEAKKNQHKQILEQVFGLSEIVVPLKGIGHGDSGGPLYCTNDHGKSFNLVGLASYLPDVTVEKAPTVVFSTTFSKIAKDVIP
ncbi:MAG: hypothetical protein QE271_05500 [Bacteriovoracaceae bacterium]|nr:hypothetical protein [Bacteriovoracaceae bacterium]